MASYLEWTIYSLAELVLGTWNEFNLLLFILASKMESLGPIPKDLDSAPSEELVLASSTGDSGRLFGIWNNKSD